jgi:hypothetical protein
VAIAARTEPSLSSPACTDAPYGVLGVEVTPLLHGHVDPGQRNLRGLADPVID